MLEKKSCGVIVMRNKPQLSFLLMQHPHRYDLPKGHMEFGEDEWSCALRELYEETGIQASNLDLDNTFRFTTNYQTQSPRFGNQIVNKTVVIFLGWLKEDVNIQVSEHDSFIWMEWKPPHTIQKKTINPLLAELDKYFKEDESRIFR
jgi:8-oxo-dGTP pyrophosphatase MutT (NUDIX family)